jgi:hypothetical protein
MAAARPSPQRTGNLPAHGAIPATEDPLGHVQQQEKDRSTAGDHESTYGELDQVAALGRRMRRHAHDEPGKKRGQKNHYDDVGAAADLCIAFSVSHLVGQFPGCCVGSG